MKYVILILTLVLGAASSVSAQPLPSEVAPLCEADCADYSYDSYCAPGEGACIDSYAQCYSRCMYGGTLPLGSPNGDKTSTGETVQCTRVPTGISWAEIGGSWFDSRAMRWRRYTRAVSLVRCGAWYFLDVGTWYKLIGETA